jgi:general secretion pathway protein K
VDLQGRFNLNNLLLPQANPDFGRCLAHLSNLLANLPQELNVPPELIGAIIDWADADQNPWRPSGAEDGAYQGLDPPYRTANRPYTVVSELLAVKGMTPDIYKALSPLVAALPAQQQATAINVNTAPEAVLLAMPGADASQVQRFVQSREQKPAHSKADLGNTMFGANAPPYDVRTSYFQIQGEVFVGSSRVALYSLINRVGTNPTILAHSAEAE